LGVPNVVIELFIFILNNVVLLKKFFSLYFMFGEQVDKKAKVSTLAEVKHMDQRSGISADTWWHLKACIKARQSNVEKAPGPLDR
jgi:hypothetical protein